MPSVVLRVVLFAPLFIGACDAGSVPQAEAPAPAPPEAPAAAEPVVPAPPGPDAPVVPVVPGEPPVPIPAPVDSRRPFAFLGPTPPEAPPRAPPRRVEECALPRGIDRSRPTHELLDQPYVRAPGRTLELDLSVPDGPGPHPVAVLIHGGGWRGGDKDDFARVRRLFASHGVAAASLDYRLAPRHPFPAAVSDVRCAVRWLRAHGEEHHLDLERVVAVGASAGGHLAALLGTAADADALDDGSCTIDASPRVDSWVAYFGAFDMRPEAPYSVPTRRVVDAFLGGGDAALASPITHVDAADPPGLVVHGTDDIVLQAGQARAMVSALRAVASPVTYIELEGAGHGFGLLTRAPEKRAATCTLLTHLGVLPSE